MRYLCSVETNRGLWTRVYDVNDFSDLASEWLSEFWEHYINILKAIPEFQMVINPDWTSINESKPIYTYKSIVIPALSVDADVSILEPTMFATIPTANKVEIRTSDDIEIKFNNILSDARPMKASESPKVFNITTTDLFISSTPWTTIWVAIQPL